jgi:hypothetical protein
MSVATPTAKNTRAAVPRNSTASFRSITFRFRRDPTVTCVDRAVESRPMGVDARKEE